jgi:succinyl-CoA synthetase alpha subunit
MKLYEYESADIFSDFGIRVPERMLGATADEVVSAAEASVFFVPAPFVLDAFIETVDAGIDLIVVVPEHIPVHDVMKMKAYAQKHANRQLFALGPTTAGILTPGEAKMGIMPAQLCRVTRVLLKASNRHCAAQM